MHRPMTPDVFEIPGQAGDASPFPWLAAWAMAAIVIGATLALVAANERGTNAGPQVVVSH
jgi:hypothetical protein